MNTWVGSEARFRGIGHMLGFVVQKDRDGSWWLIDQRAGKPRASGPHATATRAREIAAEKVAP